MPGTEDVFGSYSDYEAAKLGGMSGGASATGVAAPLDLWGILKNKKKTAKYLSEIIGKMAGGDQLQAQQAQPQNSAMQWGQLAGGVLGKLFGA